MKTKPYSLRALLSRLSADKLRALLRARAATVTVAPRARSRAELIERLAELLGAPQSLADALELIDLAQIEVLHYLLAHGRRAPYGEMAAQVRPERHGRLEEAIAGLEALGLVGSEHGLVDRLVYAPDEVGDLISMPPPMRMSVAKAASSLDAATLARVCHTLGIDAGDPPLRGPAQAAIAARLSDPDAVRRIADSLPADAAHLLQTLLKAGGWLAWYEVLGVVDRRHSGQLQAFDWTRTWALGKPRNALETLMAHGLAVHSTATVREIVVPIDVCYALARKSWFNVGIEGPPAWDSRSAGPSEGAVNSSILRDMACFLAYVNRGEATRTSRHTMHRNALKAAARLLTIPRVEYAEFLYALCLDMGMIDAGYAGSAYVVQDEGDEWMAQTPAEQHAALMTSWLNQLHWHEGSDERLSAHAVEYHAPTERRYRQQAIGVLRAAVRELGQRAVSLRSITARFAYTGWSTIALSRGVSGDRDAASALVSDLCCQSMHWLGLVELLPNAEDCTHVRLTALGRAALMGEGTTEAALERTSTFVLQPNLEVFAPPSLGASVLYRLSQAAEGSPNGVFRITRDSLRRSFDRGDTAAKLLEFLGEHSSTGVPQPLRYLIEEVGARHGHIRVGHAGLYIQVEDPVVLKEIGLHRQLKIKVREHLSDTVALITGESLERVVRDLRAAGYFPVAKGNATDSARASSGGYAARHAPSQRRATLAPEYVDARIDWKRIAAEDPAGSA